MPSPKVNLMSIQDLFGAEQIEQGNPLPAAGSDRVVMLPVSSLHSYTKHTFRVENNVSFAELVESIGAAGVLEPLLVIRGVGQGYEVIAGHRRRAAAEIIGLTEVPCIIKELSEAAADNAMVDTNISRYDSEVSHSEKAFSYRLKKEAMEKLGTPGKTYNNLAKELGEKRTKVYRYVRLTYLQPPLLQLTDENKIAFLAAVELSYLSMDEQELLLDVMEKEKLIPNLEQAAQLREIAKLGDLNRTAIKKTMGREKKQSPVKVTLKRQTLEKYFPEGTDQQDMEHVIIELLEQWSSCNG